MYGVADGLFDGNHVLDAYAATRIAAERARAGGGVTLLGAETFRMGGHATHDEREARETLDPDLFRYWGRRDPIGLYEYWLEAEGVSRTRLEEIEAGVVAEIEAAAEEALSSRTERLPDPDSAGDGVYAHFDTSPANALRPELS
jgi:acetoin:2,6-dichlorophenolindophenol oxidoreductase subunit alpha